MSCKHYVLLSILLGWALFCSVSTVHAATVQLNGDTDFIIAPPSADSPVTVTAATGGSAETILTGPTYLDISFGTGDSITLTAPDSYFFSIEKQSGAGQFTLTPACPAHAVSISATGEVVVRVQLAASQSCTVQSSSGGGGVVSGVPGNLVSNWNGGSSGSFLGNATSTASTTPDQAALRDRITQLLALVKSLTDQLNGLSAGSASAGGHFIFTHNLQIGDVDPDVLMLQKILNQDPATIVAAAGPGSAGNETNKFGDRTLEAVKRFQQKYASEILAPAGLTAPTGYVGSLTRKRLNTL